ncbi:response regulator [Chitinophagaceae bacterium MMS25-I14]
MESKKVLIIDDEKDLSLLLKGYFLRKNFEVFLSHTLDDGLKKLKTIKPDIVFLDNNLPDGEGWSIAPRICFEFPDITIHLMSAYHPSFPDMPVDARFYVLEKPIRFSDLDKQFE